VECAGCNQCCVTFPIDSIGKQENEMCRFCDVGVGCQIHHTDIPAACQSFECWYFKKGNIEEALRPDKCRVIFEYIKNCDLYLGTTPKDEPYAWQQPIIRAQTERFLMLGKPVVFTCFQPMQRFVFLTGGRDASQVWDCLTKEAKAVRE